MNLPRLTTYIRALLIDILQATADKLLSLEPQISTPITVKLHRHRTSQRSNLPLAYSALTADGLAKSRNRRKGVKSEN